MQDEIKRIKFLIINSEYNVLRKEINNNKYTKEQVLGVVKDYYLYEDDNNCNILTELINKEIITKDDLYAYKEYFKISLEQNLYGDVFKEIKKTPIYQNIFYETVSNLFEEWNFPIINDLIKLNMIDKEMIIEKILKNDNLCICYYMFNYLDTCYDALTINVENILKNNIKGNRNYYQLMGVLRNIMGIPAIDLNTRLNLLDIYMLYADIDTLMLCANKLKDTIENIDELNIYLSKIAGKIKELPIVNVLKREDINEFISTYKNKTLELAKC